MLCQTERTRLGWLVCVWVVVCLVPCYNLLVCYLAHVGLHRHHLEETHHHARQGIVSMSGGEMKWSGDFYRVEEVESEAAAALGERNIDLNTVLTRVC